MSLVSPALTEGFFTLAPPGKILPIVLLLFHQEYKLINYILISFESSLRWDLLLEFRTTRVENVKLQ